MDLPLVSAVRSALAAPRVTCSRCATPQSALDFADRLCERCIDHDEQQRAARMRYDRPETAADRYEKSGLPPHAIHQTFDSFVISSFNRATVDLVKASCTARAAKGVTLIGLPHLLPSVHGGGKSEAKSVPGTGNGKTHLLFACCNQLIQWDRTPRFIRCRDLLQAVTAEWKARHDYDPLDEFVNSRVLFIDDLTFEGRPPTWAAEALNELLDRRLNTDSRLWVSTNLSKERMQEFLGIRFVSRLHQLTTITQLLGPDRRLTS